MKYNIIVARYREIGLKSHRVRSHLERKLSSNIKSAFDCEIKINQGRVLIIPNDFNEAYEKLKRVFGIISFSPAISTYSDFKDIKKVLSKYVYNLVDQSLIDSNTSFAIRCRRVGTHNFSSQEVAAFAGSVVIERLGCPVDLTNHKCEIFLEVRDNYTYIS